MKPIPADSQTKPSARALALSVLYKTEQEGRKAQDCLDSQLARSRLTRVDRALATEIVYGTVRRRLTLDWMIACVSTRRPEKMPAWIRLILRAAAYEAAFLSRIPDHAIVSEAVILAKKHGHPGTVRLVNAVARALVERRGGWTYPDFAGDPAGEISLVNSHPRWLTERWVERYGPGEAGEIARAGNARRPLTLRTNTLRTERGSFLEMLAGAGLQAQPGALAPEAVNVEKAGRVEDIPGYGEGLFAVQDEAAMLVSHLVSPRPGDKVLDLCAGPGGKTIHMAQLMEDHGEIRSVDSSASQLRRLQQSIRRLDITAVRTTLADVLKMEAAFPVGADCVLLDAPCSNLGVLARRAEARWRISPDDISRLARLQGRLLEAAACQVRPGGILVYATCTLEPEENEDVVRSFLASHAEFSAEPPPPLLAPLSQDSFLALLPHKHGTDGAFAARLRRTD